MINILVTGSKGQLGNEIQQLKDKYSGYNFIFTDIEELDITNKQAVEQFFINKNINYAVNCAAYTAVDKAESEPELASLINGKAVKNLAEVCRKYNTFLIHISTDYVFDGNNDKPYIETDKPNPASVYGKTKLNGELEILSLKKNAIIIRTSWLYSSFGNNFVKTVLRLGKEKPQLNMVSDQTGTPTYARDLAKAILDIIPNLKLNKDVEIYHFSDEGITNWYEFAKEIIELSGLKCEILPIETKDYPTAAKRPLYSAFNKNKIKSHFNIEISHWKDSLKECIRIING